MNEQVDVGRGPKLTAGDYPLCLSRPKSIGRQKCWGYMLELLDRRKLFQDYLDEP